MEFIILFNDGRTLTVPRGEAQMWLMVSEYAFNCNVFVAGGGAIPLFGFL